MPAARLEPDADTLALYHFDEGSGDVLKDSSGNNHAGKNVGAKWVRSNGLAVGAQKDEGCRNDPAHGAWTEADIAERP